MSFVKEVSFSLESNRYEANAIPMKAYMKNKFVFFGIKSALRKSILREIINSN